jgi:iron complex outermembrane receptor protein
MKFIVILLLLINSILFSQIIEISGKVVDSKTKQPLAGVNIIIPNSNYGTASLLDGEFSLSGKINPTDTLVFSFIGYKKLITSISDFMESNRIIELETESIRLSKTIVVQGLIAEEGMTPISFSKIERKEIEDNYTVQDIPEYLSYLPSTTFYSDNGNGIGYNYIRIRGFGQRRISISVNGIPQNDPEDHNVYWLDMPDLLESTELLQVQRGAGAGVIGYPSIGGAINIITSPFSDTPNFELSSSVGSYNTRKYSAKFASGLVEDKYSIYAKLSKTLSDGYRDNSWVDFNSYHISAARYDENLTTIINLYGGPISDGLAYGGIAKFAVKDKILRKENLSYWESDGNSYTYKEVRKKSEIENFSQPHYELLNELKLNDKISFNSALFLVIGEGFFDYDGSWAIPDFGYDDYFRLKQNGYTTDQLPTNALIRAQVENKQWGWIPRMSWDHKDGTLTVGAEYRNHRSVHWGAIKYAENIPSGVSEDYKYYFYRGGKDIINFFVNENYNLTNQLNVLGEVQLAYHKYKLFDERYVGNEFSLSNLFINPRLGVNYNFNSRLSAYISYAKVTREPRLKNYYDAAESSGGAVPQFEQNSVGRYDFDEPLVKPENMNNIELGTRFSTDDFTLNTNLYYMLFNDEIVSKGQLDRFGQPITGNIDNSTHYGIEIDGSLEFSDNIQFIFNGSYSKNFISDGKTFIDSQDGEGNSIIKEINLTDNEIAGFPELTANAILKANYKGVMTQISAKFVGEYFSDNYDENLSRLIKENPNFVSYFDNVVESYVVLNFMGSYEFTLGNTIKKVRIFAQVNNLFDNLYAAYATGGDFFPAAERNFLVGLKLGF